MHQSTDAQWIATLRGIACATRAMPKSSGPRTGPTARPRGVSLIIVYKLTKAVLQLSLAGLVATLTFFGLADRVQSVAPIDVSTVGPLPNL
jgi:hypothetical protein